MRTIEHWIGGKPSNPGSSRTSPLWNPATGAQQAEVLLASAADVNEAVAVAQAAFEPTCGSNRSGSTGPGRVLGSVGPEIGVDSGDGLWNDGRELLTVSTRGVISGDLPGSPHAWRDARGTLVSIVFIRTLITGKQGTEPGRSIEQVSNTGQYL